MIPGIIWEPVSYPCALNPQRTEKQTQKQQIIRPIPSIDDLDESVKGSRIIRGPGNPSEWFLAISDSSAMEEHSRMSWKCLEGHGAKEQEADRQILNLKPEDTYNTQGSQIMCIESNSIICHWV